MNKTLREIRWKRMSYLHYIRGRQITNVQVQIQNNNEQSSWCSKRVPLIEVDWNDYKNDAINNRTSLRNEIVFDFDAGDFNYDKLAFARSLLLLEQLAKEQNAELEYWYSGSKGVHAHWFDDKLLHMDNYERYKHKEFLIDLVNAESLKKSEHVTITLEYSHNAKTGRPKLPINIHTELESRVFKYWEKNA